MRKQLTIEGLNSIERAALLSLLNESHSLFLATGANMRFDEWLELLTKELHLAFVSQISKKKS